MSGLMASLLGEMAGGDGEGDETEAVLGLEETIAALRARAERMVAPCPYKVGDLVTVRADADVKGCGEPHIVVEVLDPPVVDRNSESGSNQYLRRYDMRVAHFQGSRQTVHAIDHPVLEPWTEAHAAAWRSRRKPGKRSVSAETPLAEIVRRLRLDHGRRAAAKIDWKKGDLVEIIGHKASNAAAPMLFAGRSVGCVETVDRSDDTTRVIYFDKDGDERTQWFKPVDLKPYRTLEPVEASPEPPADGES